MFPAKSSASNKGRLDEGICQAGKPNKVADGFNALAHIIIFVLLIRELACKKYGKARGSAGFKSSGQGFLAPRLLAPIFSAQAS